MATLDIKAWIIVDDGNTEIDYVNRFPLDTGRYAIRDVPAASLAGQQPTSTEFDNDDGPPETINLEEENRIWAFAMTVSGTSRAQVSKYISDIRRHIQGKQSTAYQAYNNGSQPDVLFRMQLDTGASSPITEFIIQYGNITDNASYYSTAALNNNKALDVGVRLVCSPAGGGQTISLNNALPSSPHFIEDSDSNGVADGWSLTGTPPDAFSLDTTTWLVGGQSQRLFANNTGSKGIQLATAVTIPASTEIMFYCWISLAGVSGDDIAVRLTDGSFGLIQQKMIGWSDQSAADMTMTGKDGSTWYRVVVSGTNVAANANVLIFRPTASTSTTWYTDACYMETGTLTADVAWSSSSSLQNRYDPSLGNEGRINYLDVWNVPGDMPCEVTTEKINSSGGFQQVVAHNYSGIYEANDPQFTIDSNDFAAAGGWTRIADASLWSGGYMNSSIPNASPCEVNLISSGTAFPIYTTFTKPIRVFAVCWASDINTTFSFGGNFGDKTLERSPETSLNSTSQYEFLDLGLLNLGGIVDLVDTNFAVFDFEVYATGTSGTARINGVYLLQTDNFVIHTKNQTRGFTSYSKTQTAYNGTELGGQAFLINTSGKIASLIPHKMNRLMYLQAGQSTLADQRYIPTQTFDVTLNIRPVASHLIGE